MTPKDTSKALALAEWSAESLRLTVFTAGKLQIDPINWWNDLVEDPPETTISHPRKGESRIEGPYKSAKLTIAIGPARVDWLLTAGEESKDEGFLLVGKMDETVEKFSQLMTSWLASDSCPKIQRIAFGAILLQPTKDRESSYQQLSKYLPAVQINAVGSSDFLYQINRPGESTSGPAGLVINRLTKWSASNLRLGAMRITGEAVDQILLQGSYATRLELDINTSADFKGTLQHEKLVDIFEELISLGIEIANKGDIQ